MLKFPLDLHIENDLNTFPKLKMNYQYYSVSQFLIFLFAFFFFFLHYIHLADSFKQSDFQ